jgi:hypothetical protein
MLLKASVLFCAAAADSPIEGSETAAFSAQAESIIAMASEKIPIFNLQPLIL